MKPRTALHVLVGTLVAVALIFFASNLQAGSGSSLAQMAYAQRRTPTLWIVDACAVAFLACVWWIAVLIDHFQTFVDHQSRQHYEQLDDMIERTTQLEQVNDSYCDRIERLEAELARQFRDLVDQISTLEAAADARRRVFEMETRRISEHAYRLFEAQLQRNTSQVEAVQIALQFQRSELRRLRQDIRQLRLNADPQQIALPDSTELPAIGPGPLAIESSRDAPPPDPTFPRLHSTLRATEAGGVNSFPPIENSDPSAFALPAPTSPPTRQVFEESSADIGGAEFGTEANTRPDWRSGGSSAPYGRKGRKSHATSHDGESSAAQLPLDGDFGTAVTIGGPNGHPAMSIEPGAHGHRPGSSASNARANGVAGDSPLLADIEAIS